MSSARAATKQGGNLPASTAADMIVLDRDEEQLTPQELFERTDACGAVRDEIGQAHLQLIGAARHVSRPSRLLKRQVLENYTRLAQLALTRLERALMRLPYALIAVSCLALAGCGSDGHRDRAEAVSSAPMIRTTCSDGHCNIHGNDN